MTILSIISEYNPFHLGHKYHIDKSIEKTKANYVLSVMSGNFVQRGEPAFLDKWSRAQAAINSGVDLVLELPFIYASQRAETFANGSIRLLNNLNIVDYVSFGAEEKSLNNLSKISQVLASEPEDFNKLLNKYIGENFAYPLARSRALQDYLAISEVDGILRSSNNILAIEYLKALKKTGSKIKPVLINRLGEDYNSLSKSKKFMSATGIRHEVLTSGIDSVEDYIPCSSANSLRLFKSTYSDFNSLDKYEPILIYLLRNEIFNKSVVDATDDLIIRLVNNSRKYSSLDEIIKSTVSKTYTLSRVKRILVHILLGLTKEKFYELDKTGPGYARVLASNSKGLELLSMIKKNSKVEIISNFKSYHKLTNEKVKEIICFDKTSTDIYFSSLDKKVYNMDYLTTPYIKKETTK